MLFAGKSDAGKTHLLYQFLGAKAPEPQPTKGFNDHVVTYNDRERFEIFDPSGADSAREFWRTLYTNVGFDDVVYVVDAVKFARAVGEEGKTSLFNEDRMELHTLLCEEELRDCRFFLFLNWKSETDFTAQEKIKYMEETKDELELFMFKDPFKLSDHPNAAADAPNVNMRKVKHQPAVLTVQSFEDLVRHMGVHPPHLFKKETKKKKTQAAEMVDDFLF